MNEYFQERTELFVLRAQRGDTDAMNMLIALWTPRLRSLTSQWAPPWLIDEIVQQIWLDVFGHIAKLNEPAHFSAWIRRIAYRCSVTLLRQRGRLEQADPEATYYELAPSWLPILVGLLGPTHRLAFTMHYLDGYSIEEIAERLKLPTGTIKSRLHTSRSLLRRRLTDFTENKHD